MLLQTVLLKYNLHIQRNCCIKIPRQHPYYVVQRKHGLSCDKSKNACFKQTQRCATIVNDYDQRHHEDLQQCEYGADYILKLNSLCAAVANTVRKNMVPFEPYTHHPMWIITKTWNKCPRNHTCLKIAAAPNCLNGKQLRYSATADLAEIIGCATTHPKKRILNAENVEINLLCKYNKET